MASRTQRGNAGNIEHKKRLRREMTGPERRLWWRLRSKQLAHLKFRRQHGIGPYIVDFYCPTLKLAVEVDGATHEEEVQTIKDVERDEYLRSLGVRTMRYSNQQVMMELEGVVEDLGQIADSTSPNPSLQRRGKRQKHGR